MLFENKSITNDLSPLANDTEDNFEQATSICSEESQTQHVLTQVNDIFIIYQGVIKLNDC